MTFLLPPALYIQVEIIFKYPKYVKRFGNLTIPALLDQCDDLYWESNMHMYIHVRIYQIMIQIMSIMKSSIIIRIPKSPVQNPKAYNKSFLILKLRDRWFSAT